MKTAVDVDTLAAELNNVSSTLVGTDIYAPKDGAYVIWRSPMVGDKFMVLVADKPPLLLRLQGKFSLYGPWETMGAAKAEMERRRRSTASKFQIVGECLSWALLLVLLFVALHLN